MQPISIKPLCSPTEILSAFSVLRDLRPHLSQESFLEIYKEAHDRDEFNLWGLFVENELAAIIGMRILTDFVHGRHLYVDDLVISSAHRSKGLGANLLKFAEDEAARLRCRSLRLCTGTENHGAKRFYERESWSLKSVVYKKPVPEVS